MRLRRSHARVFQGCTGDVRPRALRVLRGALLPAARAGHPVGRDAGLHGVADDDLPAVLPAGIRRQPAGGLRRLGAGDRGALPVLPLGGGRQVTFAGVVAELSLSVGDRRRNSVITEPANNTPASRNSGPVKLPVASFR